MDPPKLSDQEEKPDQASQRHNWEMETHGPRLQDPVNRTTLLRRAHSQGSSPEPLHPSVDVLNVCI